MNRYPRIAICVLFCQASGSALTPMISSVGSAVAIGFRLSQIRACQQVLCVMTVAVCSLCLGSRGAVAEDRSLGGTSPFGRAALQIQRLPSIDSLRSDEHNDSAVEATCAQVLPVSLSNVHAANSQPWDTRLLLGYDRGFVIAADRGPSNYADEAEFLMRVNSWLQLRHTLFDSDGPNPDQNTFSFERLRLSFGGHILSPDLKYFFQFDGNSDAATDVAFLDYFATFDLGRYFLGPESSSFGVKLGKWKVPFSRSREETGRMLQFTDRATANVFFDLNRSIGVGLSSKLEAGDSLGPSAGPLEFETAIFNGFRTGSTSTNREAGLDRNFGWSLRVHGDLFDDFGDDGEPDLSWHCQPALRLGGGMAFTRVDEEGAAEFSRQRAVDSGATLSSLLTPLGVTAYDVWLYTLDTHFKYRGLSVIAEYYWRYITQFNAPGVPSLLDDGFVLQTGYFVIAERLELIARWSRITGDSGTLGLNDESSDEFGAGVVWYIKGHNIKLTFDASRFTGAPVSSSRLDLLPGDAGWLFRTQFQMAF